MLIGISGKIESGKDLVGSIIRFLYLENQKEDKDYSYTSYINFTYQDDLQYHNDFQIKKFADKLKDIVCLLINCTREELEDIEFKNKELGKEWIQYKYANGFTKDNNGNRNMLTVSCSKEKYEEEFKINWQTSYKTILTPRLLMQLIGTECGRNIIHPNIWVNALMSSYQCKESRCQGYTEDYCCISEGNECVKQDYPNWIITDMRFPNELKAVENKAGISIRVNRSIFSDNRYKETKNPALSNHPSETALDNANFNYTIDNNGTINELIIKVKEILIKEKII